MSRFDVLTRRRRAAVTALVTTTCIFAAAPTAEAAFSEPTTVSADLSYRSELFSDPAGGSTVVWQTLHGIKAARLSSDLAVGPVATLSADEAPKVPVVAGNAAGDVIAADRFDHGDESDVSIGRLGADGSTSIGTIVASGTIFDDPSVSYVGDRAAVAYEGQAAGTYDDRVMLTRLGADGSIGAATELGRGFLPELALDGDGRAAVAWFGGEVIRGTTVSPAGRAEKPATLSDGYLQAIVWGEQGPPLAIVTTQRKGTRLLQSVSLSKEPQTRTIARGDQIRAVEAARDSRGSTWMTWVENDDGTVVRARRLAANGTLDRTVKVTRAGQGASRPDLALGTGGDVALAWQTQGDEETVETADLRGSPAHPRSKTVTTTRRLFDPAITIDSAGRKVVSWTELGGGEEAVLISREDR